VRDTIPSLRALSRNEEPVRADTTEEQRKTMHFSLKKRVMSIKTYLPDAPDAMTELIALLSEDEFDFKKCTRLIEMDPALVVNILRVANSVFYGLTMKVSTVGSALLMLGRDETVSLCIVWMASKLLKAPGSRTTIDLHRLWRHSLATGVFARILARQLGFAGRTSFYLAGLMHDVGKIALGCFFHTQYEKVLALTSEHAMRLREAELQVIGESHDTVGTWLLDAWGLPEVYREVTRCHHSVLSAREEDRAIVSVVSLADQMARLRGFGFGFEEAVALEETEAFSVLSALVPRMAKLDPAGLITDLDEIARDIDDIKALM
jgi:putative nucleotidyltransferase with HDIG domain